MPKKKLDPEAIANQFKEFNTSKASDAWTNLYNMKKQKQPLELGTKDLFDHFEGFFALMFELGSELKVPGRKAKSYDQEYCRTMFMVKQEEIEIDGVKYEISNSANVENYNCRYCFVEFYNLLDEINDMDATNFLQLKKQMVGCLKEWDKLYVKHIKGSHSEMLKIITSGITPLLNLMESNQNFKLLEDLEKKPGTNIPDFRHTALETQFCEHMSIICNILKNHGDLKDEYDIKRMMNLLKLKDWKKEVPLHFYLQPLEDSIRTVREELLDMTQQGVLRVRYPCADNDRLHKKVIQMVKDDVIAQYLAGNQLRRDQLCFLYRVVDILYNSILRQKLINRDKEVIEQTIPMMASYRALLVIKDILQRKWDETQ